MTEPTKRERPRITHGDCLKMETGCGNLYVVLGNDEEGILIEIIAYLGKSGTCTRAFTEALTRIITLAIKYSVPVKEIVDELTDIRCQARSVDKGLELLSCPDAIGKVLFGEG